MLQRLVNGPAATEVQETAFSLDVLGRYLCHTYDEAVNNGAAAPPPHPASTVIRMQQLRVVIGFMV